MQDELSYYPHPASRVMLDITWIFSEMVENVGLEPTTYCVQGSRSSQLELIPQIVPNLL